MVPEDAFRLEEVGRDAGIPERGRSAMMLCVPCIKQEQLKDQLFQSTFAPVAPQLLHLDAIHGLGIAVQLGQLQALLLLLLH